MAYEYRTSFTAAAQADREETIVDGRFSSSGDIALSDGSATQGAIYFADDKNTGIYSESDGQIDITTEGKKRFSITNSGVVILNRGHASDNSSLILDKANGGYGQISFEDQGAQKSYIKVDSSENTVFSNTGTLQLYGKSQYGLNIGTNGQVQLRYLGSSKLETNANGIAITGTTNGEQATFGGSSTGLKISTWQKTDNNAGVTISAEHSSNGTLAFNTAGTERLRITKDGYLRYSGSSNADETNKLGRILARSHDTNEEDVMYFQMQQEDTFNQLELGGGSASFNAATKIIFRTAAVNTVTGVNRLEIDSSGDATFTGVVDLNPNAVSTAGSPTLKITNGSAVSGGKNYSLRPNIPSVSNTGFTIYNESDTRNELSIDGSGNATLAGGIKFNADTAAANELDDYEEGTFTPAAVSPATGTIADTGSCYTKIGRLVMATYHIGISSGNASPAKISLPFAAGGKTNSAVGGMVTEHNEGDVAISAAVDGTDYVRFIKNGGSGTRYWMDAFNGNEIRFTVWYMTE